MSILGATDGCLDAILDDARVSSFGETGEDIIVDGSVACAGREIFNGIFAVDVTDAGAETTGDGTDSFDSDCGSLGLVTTGASAGRVVESLDAVFLRLFGGGAGVGVAATCGLD